jgi:hypothetical protein
MARRREPAHIWADLGKDCLGIAAIDPGDRIEEINLRSSKRGDHLGDIVAESFDGLIEVFQMSKELADKDSVRWRKPTQERLAQ